jgi:hypothetical protein
MLVAMASLYAFANPLEYPAAFRQHIEMSETLDPANVPPAILRYLDFVTTLRDNDDWRQDVEALYAEELYFSDTLLVADRRSQLEAHFGGLRDADASYEMTVYDVLQGSQGTYLVWSVDTEFSMLGRNVAADTIGVTLFRFDDEGRIRFQQDFWDSTHGFFQHVPVLGTVIRSIRGRFDQPGG